MKHVLFYLKRLRTILLTIVCSGLFLLYVVKVAVKLKLKKEKSNEE